MKNRLLWILAIALFFVQESGAQFSKKQMKLDSSIVTKTDKLEVKMGTAGPGKLFKYRFGDYGITSSKSGAQKTSQSSNILGTKSQKRTTQRFSFDFGDAQQNTAKVNASSQNDLQTINAFQVSEHLYVGDAQVIQNKNNLIATINLNNDSSSTWKLLLVEGASPDDTTAKGILTDGNRKFEFVTVYTYEDGKFAQLGNAPGCELRENGQVIGAVQYFGGRFNNNVVWLPKNEDPKIKCMLAAAFTAIMANVHEGQGGF